MYRGLAARPAAAGGATWAGCSAAAGHGGGGRWPSLLPPPLVLARRAARRALAARPPCSGPPAPPPRPLCAPAAATPRPGGCSIPLDALLLAVDARAWRARPAARAAGELEGEGDEGLRPQPGPERPASYQHRWPAVSSTDTARASTRVPARRAARSSQSMPGEQLDRGVGQGEHEHVRPPGSGSAARRSRTSIASPSLRPLQPGAGRRQRASGCPAGRTARGAACLKLSMSTSRPSSSRLARRPARPVTR